jgi:uncharacterized protein
MTSLDDILTAVYRQDRATLERLTPADVDVRDEDGRTPLMHAILAEHADPSLVQVLIDRGADVNANDRQQWTPLLFAARNQRAAIVKQLLDAGADVDAADMYGNTPLGRAIESPTPDVDVVAALIAHGADPERKNRAGVTPLDQAWGGERARVLALARQRHGKS